MKISHHILTEILKKSQNNPQPFYIYDTQIIKDNCQIFNAIPYKNKSIHFATMANINHEFLKIVKSQEIHVFVNSILHLEAVMAAGYEPKEIIFTSSGLTKEIMQHAGNLDIQINLDSPNQLEIWKSIFPQKKVGIRCNIGNYVKPYSNHAGSFIGKESRLGFTTEEIKTLNNKELIQGLHLYAGTDIFNVDYLIQCYEELISLIEYFPNLEYLNFGGGFGVPEKDENHFDFDDFSQKLTQLMIETTQKHGKDLKMILEPGRIIGGQAGFFVCRVSDLKHRESLNLVGLNASTVQFSRPLLYPDSANHPVAIIRNNHIYNDLPHFPTLIYGCSTYSRDIFTKNKMLPALQLNDLVIFGNAGSYSASSHSNFLGFVKADEFFV